MIVFLFFFLDKEHVKDVLKKMRAEPSVAFFKKCYSTDFIYP